MMMMVNDGDDGDNDGGDAYTRCLGRSQSDVGRQSVGKLEEMVLVKTVTTVPRKNNAKDVDVGWGTDDYDGDSGGVGEMADRVFSGRGRAHCAHKTNLRRRPCNYLHRATPCGSGPVRKKKSNVSISFPENDVIQPAATTSDTHLHKQEAKYIQHFYILDMRSYARPPNKTLWSIVDFSHNFNIKKQPVV